jgi:hypothetical protein
VARHGGLFKNLPYKIVALLVGILVWFNVTENVEFETDLSIPLRLENIPDKLVVVNNPPSEIKVRVRARGRFIGLRAKGISAPLDLSGATVGRVSRLLSPADVQVPSGVRAEVLRVLSPGVVFVEMDSLGERSVPVVASLRGLPADGYTRAGQVSVSPPRVVARGPRSVVDSLEFVTTDEVDIRNARTMVTQRVGIPTMGRHLVVTPAQVSVTVPVEKLERFQVAAVPVHVHRSNSKEHLAWEPDVVRLEVRGAPSLFERWEARNVVLDIDAGKLAPGYYEYLAQPDGPQGVRLVPFQLGPSIRAQGDSISATPELRGDVALPDFLALAAVTPHTIHILVE